MKSADDIPKRLKPVCGSLFFLIVCAVCSMDLWNLGATYETWDKVTAKVVDRRLEKRLTGVGLDERYEYFREYDVKYSYNGTEYRITFVNPSNLLTDPTVEIYVNPEKPYESSLGFERGLFLAYALFSIISYIAFVLLSVLALFPHLASKDYLYETSA